MADTILYVKCTNCSGTGEVIPYSGGSPGSPVSCPWPSCGGSGYLEFGKLGFDLESILDDIKDKCDDIFEAVS